MTGEPDVARTLRAVADVFVPSTSEDPVPGAADIEADRFIAHYLESILPGLSATIAGLLDERATRLAGAAVRFADATADERAAVVASFDADDVAELRQIPQLLGMLTLGGVYGAWTGQDETGALARAPLGWRVTGFDGPSRGRRSLLT